ncbi:MAG: hypothetical protein LBP92_14710, partial [Deltaproteobacteria bacterium]|nr:hypothetical protein [Deltaproteobacteria bacterium]
APAGRSGSSLRILIPAIVVILAIAAVAGYFFFSSRVKVQAIDSFTFLMDKTFGQSKWTAEGYDFALASRSLSARNVKLDPGRLDLPSGSLAVIGSVDIVNGSLKEQLSQLLALVDWREQPDTHLADSLTLRDIKIQTAPDGKATVVLSVKEVSLSGMDLVAADKTNSPGALGFIKSSRLGGLSINGLNLETMDDGSGSMTLRIEKVQNTDFRLGQDVESLDDILGLIGSFSLKEAILEGLSVKYEKSSGNSWSFRLGRQHMVNAGRFKYDLYNISDLEANVASIDDRLAIKVSLADLTLDKIDFFPLVQRITSNLEELLSGLDPYEAYSKVYRLSDLVAMPYSFDSIGMSKLAMDINGEISFSLDNAQVKGPFVANQVPLSSLFTAEGLNFTIPTETDNRDFAKIAEFAREFGQNSFDLRYSVSSSYDPSTGTLKQQLSPFIGADKLITMNLGLSLSGLSPELVEDMSLLPITQAESLLLNPEFMGLGLGLFRLEIIDDSLTDRVLGILARQTGQSLPEYRQLVMAQIVDGLGPELSKSIEEGQRIADALAGFIAKPQSLVLEVSPSPALSLASATDMGMDETSIINSLNGLLTVNSQDPIPLRFVPRVTGLGGGIDQQDPDFPFDEPDDFDSSDYESDYE